MTEANIIIRTRSTGKQIAIIKVNLGHSDDHTISITPLDVNSENQVEIEIL